MQCLSLQHVQRSITKGRVHLHAFCILLGLTLLLLRAIRGPLACALLGSGIMLLLHALCVLFMLLLLHGCTSRLRQQCVLWLCAHAL